MRKVFSVGLILFGIFGLYTTYWNLFGMGVIVNAFSNNPSPKENIYILGIVALFSFIYGIYIWNHRFFIRINKLNRLLVLFLGFLMGWLAVSYHIIPKITTLFAK